MYSPPASSAVLKKRIVTERELMQAIRFRGDLEESNAFDVLAVPVKYFSTNAASEVRPP